MFGVRFILSEVTCLYFKYSFGFVHFPIRQFYIDIENYYLMHHIKCNISKQEKFIMDLFLHIIQVGSLTHTRIQLQIVDFFSSKL